ncbi:MAG: hypothetical protein AAF772_11920, partial [Acidobacteriota bacterium]
GVLGPQEAAEIRSIFAADGAAGTETPATVAGTEATAAIDPNDPALSAVGAPPLTATDPLATATQI